MLNKRTNSETLQFELLTHVGPCHKCEYFQCQIALSRSMVVGERFCVIWPSDQPIQIIHGSIGYAHRSCSRLNGMVKHQKSTFPVSPRLDRTEQTRDLSKKAKVLRCRRHPPWVGWTSYIEGVRSQRGVTLFGTLAMGGGVTSMGAG